MTSYLSGFFKDARAAFTLVLLLALSLAGCASYRPVPDERPAYQIAPSPVGLAPDTTRTDVRLPNTTQPGFIARIFGPKTARTPAATPIDNATQVPRKCKGCSFYYAPATVTTIGKKATAATAEGAKVTVAGKKATQATDSATQQVATNAVAGNGNTTTQTATTQQAKDWKAVLAGPVGKAGAVVLLAACAYGVYLLLPLLPRRKQPLV